jgi:hypothetical protein
LGESLFTLSIKSIVPDLGCRGELRHTCAES